MSRILIVEDLVSGREALAKLLQKEGFEVAGARNGAEALARLKEGGIDLVLLDHMMPEVDGLTFLSGIRRFPKWKNLPVIMLTLAAANALASPAPCRLIDCAYSGMNAAERAPSPNSLRKRLGTVNATVNADATRPVPR